MPGSSSKTKKKSKSKSKSSKSSKADGSERRGSVMDLLSAGLKRASIRGSFSFKDLKAKKEKTKTKVLSKEEQLESMFDKYRDEESNAIEIDGVLKLCADLSIDPENDVRILALAYQCRCRAMGRFSKEEFTAGMSARGWYSIHSLSEGLPELVSELYQIDERDFFKFVFELSREPSMKTLEKQKAVALWPLLLLNENVKESHHVPSFCAFVEQNDVINRITLDQWRSFFEFSKSIAEDFSNYDSDGAWPLILDEFVALQKKTGE